MLTPDFQLIMNVAAESHRVLVQSDLCSTTGSEEGRRLVLFAARETSNHGFEITQGISSMNDDDYIHFCCPINPKG